MRLSKQITLMYIISVIEVCICKRSNTFVSVVYIRKRECNQQSFFWDLSILHEYIRFMECFLHMSYKLDIKRWAVCNIEEKRIVAVRGEIIIRIMFPIGNWIVDWYI